MNKKISDIHQKRPELMKAGEKKEVNELDSWMIEEYFVPYQAS